MNISSIDFISDYEAINTESAFDIAASTGSKVSYDRNFTGNQACTICLPFALTESELSSIGKVYELKSVSDGKATFSGVTATEAYKPYLFIPSNDGKLLETVANAKNIAATPADAKTTVSGSYSFVGTLKAQSNLVTEGNVTYGFSANEGKFVKVTGNGVSINAFRAYIQVPTTVDGSKQRSIDIDLGGTTDIDQIEQTEPSAESYDMSGKRVGNDYKGIRISKGKKMYQM